MDKKLKVCFDCINCDQCPTGLACSANSACKMFKDRSEWVHVPCKVGDVVYQVVSERIYKSVVKIIIYDTDGIAFDERAIGKSVFLTSEEAEKALEEMSKNNEQRKTN